MSASRDNSFDSKITNFIFRILQRYYFVNLLELKEDYFSIIHSLIIQTKFKFFQL